MRVQAEVSLYPLRTRKISRHITAFLESLAQRGLEVEFGPMSSRIRGECGEVFAALAEGLEAVCSENHAILVVKATDIGAGGEPSDGRRDSNAC